MDQVTVFRTWDEPLANMALQLLKAEGINATKLDSGLRSSIALTVDGLGEIEIRVPEEEAVRANEIIEVRFSDEGEVEEE